MIAWQDQRRGRDLLDQRFEKRVGFRACILGQIARQEDQVGCRVLAQGFSEGVFQALPGADAIKPLVGTGQKMEIRQLQDSDRRGCLGMWHGYQAAGGK